MQEIVIICGPTASGKTGFAHLFAKKNNGQIVNADSVQLYKGAPIITASPDLHLRSEVAYHLYNFLEINEEYSVAEYIKEASNKIRDIAARGKLPIIVGGSGMYINALINGLSHIPAIDVEIRTKVRSLQQSLSNTQFFEILQKADPDIAKILNVNDKQRVARSYEVYLQTGRSLLEYQKIKIKPLAEFTFRIILLLPERKFLYQLCDSRLEKMFAQGAIDEVQQLIAECAKRSIAIKDTALNKALGVREIKDYLDGIISKELALEKAKLRTRQYAKRQVTWFGNQIHDKQVINFADHDEYRVRVANASLV